MVTKKLTAEEIEKLKTDKKELQKQIKARSKSYVHEFRKAVGAAIISAFAFLIALAWRDVIIEFAESMTSLSNVQSNLITAFFVTIVSVVGIMFITKYVAVKAE